MTEKKKMPLFKAQGHSLPKRLLRPYNYSSVDSNSKYERLDEKQYVQIANADKRLLFGILAMGFYSFFSFYVFDFFILDVDDPDSINSMLIFFIIGSVFTGLFFLTKPTKFLIFDREKGIVHHPKWTFSFETVSGKWEDWGCSGQVLLERI